MANDIFTDEELAADKTADLDTAPEAPLEEPGQPRDESGRFAAKEGEAEAEPPTEDKPRGDGTVPQGALHAEREKRKASDDRANKVEAELKAAREQLDAIAAMRQEISERQPAALPDADDPAALEHLRARVEQQDQTLNRFTQDRDNQAINDAEITQLRNVMASSEAEFRQTKPDYDTAISHVINARAQELSLYGLGREQIEHTIAEEAADIARSAVAQGRNPAELGYQIALSRGYRPDAPAGSGAAAATIAAIGNAREGSRSLSQAAGSTPQTLNADAVAAMDGDEFERLYSTPEGRRMIDAL